MSNMKIFIKGLNEATDEYEEYVNSAKTLVEKKVSRNAAKSLNGAKRKKMSESEDIIYGKTIQIVPGDIGVLKDVIDKLMFTPSIIVSSNQRKDSTVELHLYFEADFNDGSSTKELEKIYTYNKTQKQWK